LSQRICIGRRPKVLTNDYLRNGGLLMKPQKKHTHKNRGNKKNDSIMTVEHVTYLSA
jgi:hypothetical protein